MHVTADRTIIVSCLWHPFDGKFIVSKECDYDTVEQIVAHCRGKAKVVCNPEIKDGGYHSLFRAMSSASNAPRTMDNFDAMTAVYRLNALITEGQVSVSAGCSKLLLALQNDCDVKRVSPHLLAVLYVISANIDKMHPIKSTGAKYFDRGKYELSEKLRAGVKPVAIGERDRSWVN
jgi:hypothetical protein